MLRIICPVAGAVMSQIGSGLGDDLCFLLEAVPTGPRLASRCARRSPPPESIGANADPAPGPDRGQGQGVRPDCRSTLHAQLAPAWSCRASRTATLCGGRSIDGRFYLPPPAADCATSGWRIKVQFFDVSEVRRATAASNHRGRQRRARRLAAPPRPHVLNIAISVD